ncbi:MAG: molybdopterin-dependent oxidoreductase [Chloroflexi bacterium]|nr:molybdopterin-dependent oxidoreductase [Chloroflexota bacterium]
MGEEFEVIGKRIPRIEAVPKVTGSIKYLADMALPSMLHAKFLRSPYAHARVVNIDTSKAERLPGVKLILTPDDVIGETGPMGFTEPKNQHALNKEVRYVGDEVCAVAAVDEETAEEALELITVTYEKLPVVLDPEESMKPGAPQLHEEVNNIREPGRVRIGDIEQGFKEADCIVKARFRTSKQSHVCLDTHGCISSYDPTTGKLTHWTSTQYVFFTRLSLAEVLGLPASKVRVINPQAIGGAFGGKAVTTLAYDVTAALMSMKLGRPVRMVLSREEEFTATRSRHPFIRDPEAGLKKDGTIVAWREKAILDMGAYADWGPLLARCSESVVPGPYKTPNIWYNTYPVYTNQSTSGAYRGFGNPQTTFARESLLDMAAEQLGIDPLELRMKNIIRPRELPYTTPTGMIVRSCGMEECLNRVAEAIGWKDKRKPHTGVGVACTINWTAAKIRGFDADYGSAEVEVAADGSVIVRTGNSDLGQGLYTVLTQVAAEEMGVPPERITVSGADSETTPPDLGCSSSRSALVTGTAVKRAAAAAKERLFHVAGNMLEVDPADLVARQGKIWVKDLSRSLPIGEVASAAYFTSVGGDAGPVVGRGMWASPTTPQNEDGYGNWVPAYTFVAHGAEVEVDTETGEVKLLKLVVAADIGRALNFTIVEGQIHGGAAQGIGYGLLEHGLVYDKDSGQMLKPSIMEYKVPTAVDLPAIEPVIIETVDPAIPMGNKGVGETGVQNAAPALANAIYDAVGVRINDLPITPEKILRALARREQGASELS